jgi:hypothetical protein
MGHRDFFKVHQLLVAAEELNKTDLRGVGVYQALLRGKVFFMLVVVGQLRHHHFPQLKVVVVLRVKMVHQIQVVVEVVVHL